MGGFSAFPLADPAIIGDLNNNGNVDSSDVTLLNSVPVGHAAYADPDASAGLAIS